MSYDSVPAFPQNPDCLAKEESGMTLRDYFAAKGMQAFICAMPHLTDAEVKGGGSLTEDKIALQAYSFADAMLKARAE